MVLNTVITIVNYDRHMFIVQATVENQEKNCAMIKTKMNSC